LCTLTAVPRST